MATSGSSCSESAAMAIQILPKDVVDRIAAGEVVQRPAAAVKELVENCLDAACTEVSVTVENGGMTKLIVADNGCGIHSGDLKLAAHRHATSKLRSTEDFGTLRSFGFRGEALASISMVSRLTIVSRVANSSVAYKQSYRDGKPAAAQPTPCARVQGTTVTVTDLFYNLQHRKKLRPTDEYNAILKVMQQYAIHYAERGVSMICLKSGGKGNGKMDLNTNNLNAVKALKAAVARNESTDDSLKELQAEATKQVIGQVYGSQLIPQVNVLECQLESDDASEQPCRYAAKGLLSSPSQSLTRTTLVLFVNHRLVECSALKRAVEEVYAEFTKTKPFIYLALTIDPDQVDVNIHPTKREVALLHLEAICKDLSSHVREHLSAAGQSFQKQSVAENPYKCKRPANDALQALQQPKVAPSKKIRTNKATQAGALEPFLVPTQQTQNSLSSQSTQMSRPSPTQQSLTPQDSPVSHKPGCPLASRNSDTDLSQPGAFATLASRCTCNDIAASADVSVIRLPRQALTRPKKVFSTECNYTSIMQLRKRIAKRKSSELEQKLRSAYFVGVVSHHRSLIQCGEELVLINHYECAREMLYQLALARFGGAATAKLGQGGCGGVDVEIVIADVVQMEEKLAHHEDGAPELTQSKDPLVISDTNKMLAEQATACLFDNAEMLEEYFSICIEKSDNGRILLTGLPVLLDGYAPAPHGLPIFLLRLATEVDWTEEKPCFHSICRELAAYYAELPYDDDDIASHVRHTIFPAISSLLVPPEQMKAESFTTTTSLSMLYKVFERC